MASSANSSDHDSETEEDVDASRFVVSADQMRDGDFYTLDDVREDISTDGE